jgi:hypothetical protein
MNTLAGWLLGVSVPPGSVTVLQVTGLALLLGALWLL